MTLPLAGLLVVSLEQAVAAPYCSMRFADAGARVVKIERADGDFARKYDNLVKGESAYFSWLNRGKESLVLDIKTEPDQALMWAMLEKADVFIQNLRPGAAEALGFGEDDLAARFPNLISVSISGYGDTGPLKDMKAYDLLVQAESGLASITGGPDGPGRVGVSVCDIATGMYAYSGALEALFARERHGGGGRVRASLFHSMADWMSVPYLQFRYGGKEPRRVGLNHPTIAPYGAYPCADGDLLLISIQNEREWARLCERILGDAALAADSRFNTMSGRVANRPALDTIIEARFGRQSRHDLSALLLEAGIAFGAVNDVKGFAEHPQLRVIDVTLANGETVDLIAPPTWSPQDGAALGPVPALGEHSAAIRSEFGF